MYSHKHYHHCFRIRIVPSFTRIDSRLRQTLYFIKMKMIKVYIGLPDPEEEEGEEENSENSQEEKSEGERSEGEKSEGDECLILQQGVMNV